MDKIKYSLLVLTIFFGIILIVSCGKDNSKILNDFIASVEIPTEVEDEITLKNTYEYQGNTINVKWVSTNEDIISSTGVIKRKEIEQTVIIVCEATLGDKTLKKTFYVTVKADLTNQILERAAAGLILPSTLESSLNLPTTKKVGENIINITWSSSNTELLGNDGSVTLAEKETNVILSAALTLNNQTVVKTFEVMIAQDPNKTPAASFHLASVYTGVINGELKPGTLNQFNGAVYRKCVSSKDYWIGIETVVTLPEFIPDEKRQDVSPYDTTAMRYLDNASVYLGGNASTESDVGLSWMIGANFEGNRVDYSKSIAYRPFWRWIDGKNNFANASWQDTCYYYYPGDKIRMSCYSTKENYLQLRIELLEETKIEKYANIRKSYNLGSDYPKVFISPEFYSRGHGISKAEFKRVCALDQVNNEGKAAQKTNAKSLNTVWNEVYLYRKINGIVYKVPMTENRFAYCNAPSNFVGAITVSYNGVNKDLGGEIVTLDPNNN